MCFAGAIAYVGHTHTDKNTHTFAKTYRYIQGKIENGIRLYMYACMDIHWISAGGEQWKMNWPRLKYILPEFGVILRSSAFFLLLLLLFCAWFSEWATISFPGTYSTHWRHVNLPWLPENGCEHTYIFSEHYRFFFSDYSKLFRRWEKSMNVCLQIAYIIGDTRTIPLGRWRSGISYKFIKRHKAILYFWFFFFLHFHCIFIVLSGFGNCFSSIADSNIDGAIT